MLFLFYRQSRDERKTAREREWETQGRLADDWGDLRSIRDWYVH